MSNRPDFICTQCSACCQRPNLSQYNLEYWGLTIRDDGRCCHLDDAGLCSIYEDRPLLCRVEELLDRVEEIREAEPGLYAVVKRFALQIAAGKATTVDYFKHANAGCNLLIDRLGYSKEYKIDLDEYGG